jgi:hypothetical protein
MNKYGRATKMTSPPPGMPAEMAKKYAEIEGSIEKVVTMNRGLIESGGLKGGGYDPNEMVEIDDKKTGKKTKVPYGSYEHQTSIYTPKDRFARNFGGISPDSPGVQRFRDADLSNYNANPTVLRQNAGLKVEELRTAKGSNIFKKGSSDTGTGAMYQQQYESPIKGVTDLPSRYAKEQSILTDYETGKNKLAEMEEIDAAARNLSKINMPKANTNKKLAAPEVKVPSAKEWENPEGANYRTKKTIIKSGTVEAKGEEGASGGKSNSVNKSVFTKRIKTPTSRGGYGIQKGSEVIREEVPKGRYKREEKMAKSFYGKENDVLGYGGYSKTEGQEWQDTGRAKRDIKNIREAKREYKKESIADPETKREAIQEYNASKKTARLANRYVKKADLGQNGDDSWRSGNKSRIKYFTPDSTKEGEGAMRGYVAAATSNRDRLNALNTQEKSISAKQKMATGNSEKNKLVKMSEDNAANRNSSSARMKTFWGY